MNEPQRVDPYTLATWRGAARSAASGAGAGEDPRPEPADPYDEGERVDGGGAPREEPGPDPRTLPDPPELPRSEDSFELARRSVNRSRAAARDKGLFPISRSTMARDVRDRSGRSPGYSGARPDARDPQGIQRVLRRVLGDLGWNEGMNAGRVLEEWDDIVGEQISATCRPVSLDDGVLVISAASSAWASQMRMLSPQIITRIEEHIGAHVVTELKVTGPAAQSWKKGRRTVTWRGPRDTYG